MKQRTVGRSGLRVSRVGLGTRAWGTQTGLDEAAAQLAAFVEAGGTLVDTSPAYGGGIAVRMLGELLDDVVPRDDVVLSVAAGLASPIGFDNVFYDIDASRRAMIRRLDQILIDLGVDHVDLWNLDGWDSHTPVDELADTAESAIAAGKACYLGVSGLAGWQLATVASATSVTAGQVPYSILDRDAEHQFLPAARYHEVGVFAAAPLSGGILTGKYLGGFPVDSRGADEAHADEIRAALDERAVRVAEAVVTAADGLATSPLAVALAWARDRPGVAATVVGARDSAQLLGVLAAEALELPHAISAAIDDVSS